MLSVVELVPCLRSGASHIPVRSTPEVRASDAKEAP